MVLAFLFPRYAGSAIRGSGKGEEPSGENALRLIQIRLTAPSLEKLASFGKIKLAPCCVSGEHPKALTHAQAPVAPVPRGPCRQQTADTWRFDTANPCCGGLAACSPQN